MSPSIISSQITKAERWVKLYRTIHHLFLQFEFVHIEDYNLMVQQMNARILAVETNANASIAAAVTAIKTAIVGHTHATGVGPSGPGIIPVSPLLVPPAPAPPVVPVLTAMLRTDSQLMSLGPASAPLASGVEPDQLMANTQIIGDIGAV